MARGSGKGRRHGRRRDHGSEARFRRYLIAVGVAAVVVAVVIVVAALARGGDGGGGGGPLVVPSPRPAGLAQEGHVLGSASAPVTIIEYLDFQ